MRKYLLLLFAAVGLVAFAARHPKAKTDSIAQPELHYRLTLSDKAGSPYSLDRPGEFLSAKSLERRQRLGLTVDHYDLPITPSYLKAISATGARILNHSKWNNTVQVCIADSLDGTLDRLRALPFVTDALLVFKAPKEAYVPDNPENRQETQKFQLPTFASPDSLYGAAQHQADMLNVPALHNLGFRGEGITIAVLDGGFYNADIQKGLATARILGTRDYVGLNTDFYAGHTHGMMVLSCIAANVPGSMVGTAPDASFYLLLTEDTERGEYRGEEDNWCAAVEYADSLGVDLITSSLGYTHFDTPEAKLEYRWLDGAHEINSRSASLCASRGILLCNSAGNEGDGAWKKIGFPADAHDILIVGAVKADGVNTDFSSIGNTADGRIKPDVMAMGGRSTVLDGIGSTTHVNGTSFSCPIMAGAAACLLQAHPSRRPEEIIDALHRAGNNAEHPDNIFGYGIPDVIKAHELLK